MPEYDPLMPGGVARECKLLSVSCSRFVDARQQSGFVDTLEYSFVYAPVVVVAVAADTAWGA